MNLHGLVRGVIGVVNPDISVTYMQSNGYTTAADGKRTPAYVTTTEYAQVQAASGRDIERLNNLGVQGVMRKVFDYGNKLGIARSDGKGGDLFMFPEVPGGAVKTWKVTSVMETWQDFCSVIVVMQ